MSFEQELLDLPRKQIGKHGIYDENTAMKSVAAKIILSGSNTRESQGKAYRPESHSPHAMTTGNIECPQCKSITSSEQRFCSECGERLWNPCPACQELNLFHQKYCCHCGVKLVIDMAALRRMYETVWEKAGHLREGYYFDEAINVLKELSNTPEPGADDFIKATHDLMFECTLEQKRLQTENQKLGELADQCLQRFEYQKASDLLEVIPAPLMTGEIKLLFEKAQQGLAEIRQLRKGLETVGESPLAPDIVRTLGHYLDLCPQDQLALGLANRFRKAVRQSVDKILMQCQYDKAVSVFDRIPANLFDETLNLLQDRSKELSWLAWDLRRSPVIDSIIPQIATKMVNLAPHDQKSMEICRTLQSRLANNTLNKSFGNLPWAVPPERTILGPPVQWIGNMERIKLAPNGDLSAYYDYPGRFAVACGLALQGLDLGPIKCNFFRNDDSLLKRMASWKIQRKPTTTWGIDLGSRALKVVKMQIDKNDRNVVLEVAMCIEHGKPLSQAHNDDEYKLIVGETFKKFVSQHKPEQEPMCLGLSAVHFFFCQFEMPGRDPTKIPPAVHFKAKQMFPISLEDLNWDYIDLSGPIDSQQENPMRKITALGIKSMMLKSRLKIISESGIKADLVQCDTLALYNYAAYNYFPEGTDPKASQDDNKLPLAMVDFGGDMIKFVVCAPQVFWLRNFSIGSDRLNTLLVRNFKLTYTQAEKWKRDPTAAPDIGKLWDVLQDGFADISLSIREAADAYQNTLPIAPIRRYLTVGGGFLVHGLLRYLWFER